ncbi:MAG: hypothetical protein ACI8PZ_002305 [Myxococcota bacterium]|jgi:hypothetical protein
MDRRVVAAAAGGGVLVIAAVAVGAWWAADVWRGGDVSEVAERIPADASTVMAVRGFVQLVPVLSALRAHPDDPLARVRQGGELALGLDPTDPGVWAASGFDPARPMGVASWGRAASGEARFAAWLPVRDPAAALAQVEAVLAHTGGTASRTEVAGREAWRAGRAAWTLDEDWLVIAQAGRGESPPSALEAVLAPSASIASDPSWQAVRALLPDPWHALVFVAPDMLASTAGRDARVAALDDFGARGAGASLVIGLERSTVRLAVANGPSAEWVRLYQSGGDGLADSVPGRPLLVGRAGVDVQRSLARMRATDAKGWAREVAAWQERLGIDAEALLGTLDGQVSVAILEGDGSPDALAYAPVRDVGEATTAVAQIAASMGVGGTLEHETTPDGQEWWFARAGGVGLARGHLVFAGAPGHRERIRDALAVPGTGYADALPDDIAAALRDGPPLVFWWDVQGTMAFLEASPAFSQWLSPRQRSQLSGFAALGGTMEIVGQDAVLTVHAWPAWSK